MRLFKSTKYRLSAGLLLFCSLSLSATAMAEGLNIKGTIPFTATSGARDAVKAECNLEHKVPEFVKKYAAKGFDSIKYVTDAKASKGKSLDMAISHVHAPGGGRWSGPKSMTVTGTLYDSGKKIGSFEVRRSSSRGGGTCSFLARSAKTIGKDIGKWLAAPSMNARLGELK